MAPQIGAKPPRVWEFAIFSGVKTRRLITRRALGHGKRRPFSSRPETGRDLRSRSASPSALKGDTASASKEVLRFGELSPYPKRMCEENKIDGAHKIGETASRTRQAQRATAQPRKNILKREGGRH